MIIEFIAEVLFKFSIYLVDKVFSFLGISQISIKNNIFVKIVAFLIVIIIFVIISLSIILILQTYYGN